MRCGRVNPNTPILMNSNIREVTPSATGTTPFCKRAVTEAIDRTLRYIVSAANVFQRMLRAMIPRMTDERAHLTFVSTVIP